MTSATMSTDPLRSAGIRCAYVSTRYSTLFGSPKIARATSRTMSMSNPSRLPETGFRKPNNSVSAETPAMSRPRCQIVSMNDPGGMGPGAGRGRDGANDATGSPQLGARVAAGDVVDVTGAAAVGLNELPESHALSAVAAAISTVNIATRRPGARPDLTGTPAVAGRPLLGPRTRRP